MPTALQTKDKHEVYEYLWIDQMSQLADTSDRPGAITTVPSLHSKKPISTVGTTSHEAITSVGADPKIGQIVYVIPTTYAIPSSASPVPGASAPIYYDPMCANTPTTHVPTNIWNSGKFGMAFVSVAKSFKMSTAPYLQEATYGSSGAAHEFDEAYECLSSLDTSRRRAGAQVLIGAGKAAADWMIEKLADEFEADRLNAATFVLSEMGETSLPPIMDALERHPNSDEAECLLNAIRHMHFDLGPYRERLKSILQTLASSPDSGVQKAIERLASVLGAQNASDVRLADKRSIAS